jgi:hypothetical protein
MHFWQVILPNTPFSSFCGIQRTWELRREQPASPGMGGVRRKTLGSPSSAWQPPHCPNAGPRALALCVVFLSKVLPAKELRLAVTSIASLALRVKERFLFCLIFVLSLQSTVRQILVYDKLELLGLGGVA